MEKAIIVKSDPSLKIVEFNVGKSSTLIKETVDGLFDCIHLPSLGVDMWINDEGKILELPMNAVATLMFAQEFNTTDYIAGDVIFTGGVDSAGNTLGLNVVQSKAILETMQNVVHNIIQFINTMKEEVN
jgi:hypothetical protein